MKKYLIVLAAALVALASCKENKPAAEFELAIRPAEVTLIIGDTTRLASVITPAEVEIPADLVWASSDTNVVKVVDQNGTITAVGAGQANVTVTSGEKVGICRVTAAEYEALWELDWIYYFPSTEQVLSDTVELYGYKCLLKSYEFFCPNKLDFAEDLSAGEGPCVFATAIVPVIADTASDYDGTMLARQFQIVENASQLGAFTALKGSFDPAIVGQVFQPYFEALDNEEEVDIDWDLYETGVNGAVIGNARITESGSISYSYVKEGIVTSGTFIRQVNAAGDAYECVFDFTAEWFGGFWALGLATNYEAESYSEVLVQPYAYEVYAAYHYKTGEEAQKLTLNSAPAHKALKKIKANKKNWYTRAEKPVRVKFADFE